MNTPEQPKQNPQTKPQSAAVFTLSLILATGLVMIACQDRRAALANADAAGVYALVLVDGKQVPAEVSHEGAALQVRSGAFTLNADGTCSSKTIFVPPTGGEVTREVSATYTQDGSRLNMQWMGAGRTVGTIEGDTFTMNNGGMVFVYRK